MREILTVAGGAIGQNERDTLQLEINTLSVIKDADIAEELADLTKQQLLVQSSSTMVGQANLVPEGVLLLLQQ